MGLTTQTVITAIIGAVLGVALYPVIADTVTEVNASGIAGTLMDLIPIVYLIIVIAGLGAYLYTQK